VPSRLVLALASALSLAGVAAYSLVAGDPEAERILQAGLAAALLALGVAGSLREC